MKIGKNVSKCSGCKICQLKCSLRNAGENNPKKAFIQITGQFPQPGGYKVKFLKGCTLCGECLKWCPTKAIWDKEPEKPASKTKPAAKPKPLAENELPGYAGKILKVNLSDGSWLVEPLDPVFAKEYIGGRGFAAKLLYDTVPKGVDPFAPENPVVIASGPLSGTFVPAGGKVTFASKSPLTMGYGDSNMGGHLAAEMKYAGYDAIVITGAAEHPCYLYIEDDRVEIRDASKYWGKGSMDAEKMFKDDLGEDFQIAVIGPAGENRVRFACVSHDFGRQAGRTGIGAVMGSKRLKAIAVKGTKAIPLADFYAAMEKGEEMFRGCLEDEGREIWQHLGTPGVVGWVNDTLGALPVRNFKTEALEDCTSITGDRMRQEIVLHDKACFGCPMPCGKYSRAIREGKYDVFVEGPEYETIALCGSNCGITDIRDIAYANYLCDQYGLDTISTGGVIAFAIECFEKGIIPKDLTDGRELKFGDIDTFEYLARKIAFREGLLGMILSLGTRFASAILECRSRDFAIQAKGLEWSGYGSRWAPSQMLAYMTCDVGAHHNRCWVIGRDLELGRDVIEGKAQEVIYKQHARPMFDMLGVCRLMWVELKNFPISHYPEILKAVTGFNYSLEDLLKISEKVWNLTRAFWIRENPDFCREYDWPPARFYEEEVSSGPARGKKMTPEKLNQLLDEYYRLRGWDSNGWPTKEKLQELGLDFVIMDIYPSDRNS